MTEKLTKCLNCEADLPNSENYCPNCGQKNHPTRLSLRSFVTELVHSLFNIDSKIWITLKAAFLNIGQLVREFNQGKRRKYVRPVQFYLFCSLIYFLLLGIETKKYESEADQIIKELVEEQDSITMGIGFRTIKMSKEEFINFPNLSNQGIDSLLTQKGLEPVFHNRFLIKQSIKILKNGIKGIQQQINSIASAGMFILMPILAWFLYLFFSKTYPFYVEHLVFSVYLHSVCFLFLSVKTIFNIMVNSPWTQLIAIVSIAGFTFLGLKQFYTQSWQKSIPYYLALFFLYSFILILFVAIISIISLTLF